MVRGACESADRAGHGRDDAVAGIGPESFDEPLEPLELEDDDYTTIAGLVVTENGTVPKIGEKLTVKDLDIEIREADEKRITLLRIQRAVLSEPPA